MNFPELYETFIVHPADQDRIETFIVDHLKGSHVLDLGCGTGWLAKRLAQRGYVVDAWDAQPDMIDFARKHHAHPKVNYQCFDLRTASLKKHYDAILLINDTLNHVLDVLEVTLALEKVSNQLSDNGVLIFDVYDPSVLELFAKEHLEHDQVADWTLLWSIQANDDHVVHQLSVDHPTHSRRSYDVIERVYSERVYEDALAHLPLTYQKYFDYDTQQRKGMKQVYVGHKS